MSFFNLDSDRLVRIFEANGMRMSLRKAFKVARIIADIHSDRVIEVENNIWEVARQEKAREVAKAYDNGFEAGQRQATVNVAWQEKDQLAKLVAEATVWAMRNYSKLNPERRIQSIKTVREQFPLLGIRDAKNIVDQLI